MLHFSSKQNVYPWQYVRKYIIFWHALEARYTCFTLNMHLICTLYLVRRIFHGESTGDVCSFYMPYSSGCIQLWNATQCTYGFVQILLHSKNFVTLITCHQVRQLPLYVNIYVYVCSIYYFLSFQMRGILKMHIENINIDNLFHIKAEIVYFFLFK